MLALMGGCFRGVVILLVIGGLAVFGFLNRDRLSDVWHDVRGVTAAAPEVPTRELADAAQQKLYALERGDAGSVSLSTAELQSLLQYNYATLLPSFVDSPRVELDGDRIRVRGRVPLDRLPDVAGMSDAAALLPDTTDVAVTGQLLPLGTGRVALGVDDVSVSRIPLPDRLIAPALRRLGRTDEASLPPDALALPLPPGADGAYVRGDSLVLVGGRGNGDD